MSNSWRCVLIGSESLLIQCAQMLEQAGHRVVAVVSSRPMVTRWAAQRGVRALPDAAALQAARDLGTVDYLFSVTNLSVLPADIIALPTRAAINFHDGPLPEYAGLNTPVWALLNGERQHGITWHLMTAQVDQGDILVQRRFDLADNETALTLNTKCFEAGIAGFEELVRALADGTLAPQPQSGAFQHYIRGKDRPAAACAIAWEQDEKAICTLVRALDFGNYANPVGTAKAVYAGQMLVVAQARALETTSGQPPGTIVSVTGEAVTVATGGRDVQLLGFVTLEGLAVAPTEAATRFGLRAEASFDVLDAARRERLTALNAAAAPHESFWLQRLESRTDLSLPYIDRSAQPAAPAYHHADIAVQPPPQAGHAPAERAGDVVAALLAWLARLCDKDSFDIAYTDVAHTADVSAAPGWFAAQLPLRVAPDFQQGYAALREAVRAEGLLLQRRVGYATDLPARAPTLHAGSAQQERPAPPVAVTIVSQLERAHAAPGSELTIAVAQDGSACRWVHDASRLSASAVADLQAQFGALWAAAQANPGRPLAELPLMSDTLRAQVLTAWNHTEAPWRTDACVHHLFAEQAARTPDRVAVTCEGRSLTYGELNRRANQLARRLAAMGVRADTLVGLCVERSIEMMVGLMAIHKAGGAYVPLDPTYPRDRIAYMLQDARVAVLLTQESLRGDLPRHGAALLCLDTDWPMVEKESAEPFDGGAQPHHLAYVIYTSGSTGQPKGVMVEHRNVVNFFAGMDHHMGQDEPGVWLAVTSLSFDISVLELCWTIARGYSVVIGTDEDRAAATTPAGAHADRAIDFSLFYFSSDESEGVSDKYRLLLEGARYADQHGFAAVWTPERHFHAFGGLYPNPAVTSAAIAAITERVKIRSGSVVLPLHHPVRVAEEWSVVDNISKGRVGISFASGWQPNDFVLRPENFADNKNIMLRDIETVRKLWRGESVSFPGATGKPVEVSILPRPIQPELPYWVTSAGNPETFRAAGRLGANVLTHLLGQTVEELKDKLAAYRQAWKEAGHPGEGHVSLMLHTFVGPDAAAVRDIVRQPMIEYLRSSLNLVKQYAWSFPAFKRREGMADDSASVDLQSLNEDEMNALLEFSFERYYETSGLFGTPESCVEMVDRIKGVGVDEVACLIDFGIQSETVLNHLDHLNQLRRLCAPRRAPNADYTLAALMRRHEVTHLQCTPSMARMLVADPQAAQGLAALRRMMVGGEALPAALGRELTALVRGEVMNMYGPTETTIWSAVHTLNGTEPTVPLGRPLANQAIYLLDARQQPVPVGVPGELVIGGHGVVRGYLHRPELTDQRFLPDPLRGVPGARMYRTGDLAMHKPDGTLLFLGRLDHQVKVRGYRIELGEIESALMSHASVREAVVVAREDIPGDVRLVAYVVAQGEEAVAADLLREHARSRLPEYMVPSHVVALAAMPQTPNGKVDRKALPAPQAGHAPASAQAYVAPENDLEESIAAIWRDVLKLPQVGVRDNFFDLGGHSLLAVQAHRRLREALQRELSITDIFRFPTIATLSAYLGQGQQPAAAQQGTDRAQGRRAAMQRRQQMREGATVDNRG